MPAFKKSVTALRLLFKTTCFHARINFSVTFESYRISIKLFTRLLLFLPCDTRIGTSIICWTSIINTGASSCR